jgi:poly-gamma-glutamate synthesis protein (capsule biosynthesis protein)
MVFCGDLRHLAGLQFAGVDVVNLANNHMGNHSQAGVDSTVAALQAAGMATPGINDPTYVDVRGQTWAFLGYNEVDQQVGIQLSEADLVRQQVTEARARADIVIVQFHWGVEYRYHPTAHQRQLARIAIDAGADLIIGNHPHWFQALEMYNGKLITYSHGNFIFDQMWSNETREGLVGKYTFYDDQLIAVEYWPVWIELHGQPRWLEEEAKQRLLEILKQESQKLITP